MLSPREEKNRPPAEAFVAEPDLAGDRLDENHENKRVCTGNLKAEHISKVDWQAQMDKCAPDPTRINIDRSGLERKQPPV
jgi:hypothetical protein